MLDLEEFLEQTKYPQLVGIIMNHAGLASWWGKFTKGFYMGQPTDNLGTNLEETIFFEQNRGLILDCLLKYCEDQGELVSEMIGTFPASPIDAERVLLMRDTSHEYYETIVGQAVSYMLMIVSQDFEGLEDKLRR